MAINSFRASLKIVSMLLVMNSDLYAFDNRSVFVNGRQLSQVEIGQLERLHGESIPDGNYWLDSSSGYWGYVGGPAQGILGRPDVEFNAGDSEGRAGKRWFEDEVSDFCARHGGC